MKLFNIGYTTGVFDLFHVGHLNILKSAKKHCQYLIVGVSTDELVASYKNKKTIIPYSERIQIVESIKYVDKVVPQVSMDKTIAWREYKFDVVFVGDDWKGSKKWDELEFVFHEVGVEIIYFPYTTGTSSTKIREMLSTALKECNNNMIL